MAVVAPETTVSRVAASAPPDPVAAPGVAPEAALTETAAGAAPWAVVAPWAAVDPTVAGVTVPLTSLGGDLHIANFLSKINLLMMVHCMLLSS